MIVLVWTVLALQATPAAEPKKEGLPLTVTYDDGIWFKSDDGNFIAAINGRLAVHYRSIFDRPDDTPPTAGAARTQPNSLFLRTARVDLQGLYRKQFEFKLLTDFPTGVQSNIGAPPSSTTGQIQDAHIAWRPSGDFNIRLGQFKEPFGQEQTTSFRVIDFNERAVLDRLVPGRDIGLAVQARLLDAALELEAGAFNGSGKSINDGNDEKEAVGRIRVSPLRGLRLGVAGSIGDLDAPSTNPADPLDFTSTELNIKFLDAGGAGNAVDGRRARGGLEVSWIWEMLSVRAETVRRVDHVVTPSGKNRLPSNAWVVSATAILTGEPKALENRIVPLHPVDLDGGWGALEFAIRVAQLRVDDDVFSLGLAAPGNANAVRTATAGLNWWPTRFLRISPDFILERYNRDIVFGSGRTEKHFQGFLMRVQVDF
jgi:phosphate-selective porin OprO and OprP